MVRAPRVHRSRKSLVAPIGREVGHDPDQDAAKPFEQVVELGRGRHLPNLAQTTLSGEMN